MPLDPSHLAGRVRAALAAKTGDPGPLRLTRCADGAVRETWRVEGHGLIVRSNGATDLVESQSRAWEYARLRRVHGSAQLNGLVPRPVLLAPGAGTSPPFFIMTELPGAARPAALRAEAGRAFVVDAAVALARLHRVPTNAVNAGEERLAALDGRLSSLAAPRPALAWALAWLRENRPGPGETVMTHRDYRVGNLMIENRRLTGVLDWEFAGPSDPHEDLGWFSAPAWRYGRLGPDAEAGGVAPWSVFKTAYEEESGRIVQRKRLHWWRVLAQCRWGLIALEQAVRGRAPGASLDLALSGHRVPGVERDVLRLLGAPTKCGVAVPFTPDTPDAATLRELAERADGRPVEADLARNANALADRLDAAGDRDVDRAAALLATIVRGGPDPSLLPTLMADATARAAISDWG